MARAARRPAAVPFAPQPPAAAAHEDAWLGRRIPRPPSVNGLYRNNKNAKPGQKGRVRTTRYEAWCALASWEVRVQGPLPRVNGAYELIVLLGRRKGSDLDNYAKALSDWLKKMGVIGDDSLCEDLRLSWADNLNAKQAFFFIRAAPKRAIAPSHGVRL